MNNLTTKFIPPSKFLKDQQHNYYRLCFEKLSVIVFTFSAVLTMVRRKKLNGMKIHYPHKYLCSDTSIYYSFKQ